MKESVFFNYHILKLENNSLNWYHFAVNENLVSISGDVEKDYHVLKIVGFNEEISVKSKDLKVANGEYFFKDGVLKIHIQEFDLILSFFVSEDRFIFLSKEDIQQ